MISYSTVESHPPLQSEGPSFRKGSEGPEDDLVEQFAVNIQSSVDGVHLTKFREPQINGSFPDLVIVYWEPAVTRSWPSDRRRLRGIDYKVLQCLRALGQAGMKTLKSILNSDVSSCIERLRNANLVFKASHTWRPRSIQKAFAVRRLVAIEAKIKNWKQGLEQAVRNRWFASESYLLLGEKSATKNVLDQAESYKVGLLTSDDSLKKPQTTPQRRQLPCSYVSWLFNDWSWWSWAEGVSD